MENKLIGQRLADLKKRKTHAMYMYIMQNSYPCIIFLFHSQNIHKIRNDIRKHSQAFLTVIVKHFASIHIHKVSVLPWPIISFLQIVARISNFIFSPHS